MEQSEFIALLEKLGEDLSFKIVKILETKNKRATGDLINSIDYAIGARKGEYFVQLLAENYWSFINYGFKAHWIPIQPLKDWAAVKGLPESVAYATRWKYRPEGGVDMMGLFFLEEAIRGLEAEYAKEIESAFGSNLEEETFKKFSNAFKALGKR